MTRPSQSNTSDAGKDEPSERAPDRHGLRTSITEDAVATQAGGLRASLAHVVNHQLTETFIGLIVLFNMYVVIVDTDYRSVNESSDSKSWITVANFALLVVYTVELLLRLFVYRLAFFHNSWNNLDLTIVSIDIITLCLSSVVRMPKVTFLRVLRLLKLVRAVRILLAFPELYMLVRGMVGAFKAILWGTFLILVIITLFGIAAVELIHPINVRVESAGVYGGCERCGRAFETVPDAVVTFTQTIVAGDSWGQVSIPIVEEEPFAFLFFLATFISVGMGVTNLILAVIVDRAHEARQEDLKQVAKMKENDANAAKKRLEKLCEDMDTDGSGAMSLDEILVGYDSVPEFADLLRVMDITRDDLQMVFNILDQDGSGDVDYAEFADQLYKMKSHDVHTLIIFVKYYVIQILDETRKLHRRVSVVDSKSPFTPQATKTGEFSTPVAAAAGGGMFPPMTPADASYAAAAAAAFREAKEEGIRLEAVSEPKMLTGGLRSNGATEDISAELRRLNTSNEELSRLMREVVNRVDAQAAEANFMMKSRTAGLTAGAADIPAAFAASVPAAGAVGAVPAQLPTAPAMTATQQRLTQSPPRSTWACCPAPGLEGREQLGGAVGAPAAGAQSLQAQLRLQGR